MPDAKQFSTVANLRPGYSAFDLSYEKKFTCNMGELIPVCCDEMVPGDTFKIGADIAIRFQPLVSPVLHQITAFIHYFFVPYRLLWCAQTREDLSESGDWMEFITGGEDGTNADTIPTWSPADSSSKGTLWDYMGMPLVADPDGYLPIDFPRRAYNFVYNEWYRDEWITSKVAWTNDSIKKRMWQKAGYFESLLDSQQKGTAPALPITGTTQAVWPASSATNANNMQHDNVNFVPSNAQVKSTLENNTVDLSSATTFDIADLRLTTQVQIWLERNARAGSRPREFIKSHFGVDFPDFRSMVPEYIGGCKAPVIVSEVLQTESSDASTPLGELAGHGLAVASEYCGSYRAKEFGLIIGMFSVMPKPCYSSQGINRQWLRESRYDFYFPEFANLSEQGVEAGEIYVTSGNSGTSETILGYQGRYDEMRVKNDMVCDDMRDTFDYYHYARQFSASPTLNTSFLECDPRTDPHAVPAEPVLMCSIGNRIIAVRPMPIQAEPGLMDHPI